MEHDVVRWYTRARRFPQLIGRTHDGTRIPGGPYTYAQFIAGFVMVFIGVNTMSVWGRFDTLTNAGLLFGVSYAAVWLIGRVPVGSRNPLSVVGGFARAINRPRLGTVRGRPPRVRRPHRVRHALVIGSGGMPPPAASRAEPKPSDAGQAHARSTPLTGVQQVLAAARASGGGQ